MKIVWNSDSSCNYLIELTKSRKAQTDDCNIWDFSYCIIKEGEGSKFLWMNLEDGKRLNSMIALRNLKCSLSFSKGNSRSIQDLHFWIENHFCLTLIVHEVMQFKHILKEKIIFLQLSLLVKVFHPKTIFIASFFGIMKIIYKLVWVKMVLIIQ